MDTVKIGRFLAELRRENKLTQEQLAEKLGTSNKTISRWENGNYMPPVEMLCELSEFYGVSINEILSGRRLDETETKPAAEENLKDVLALSAFGLEVRKEYFAKKWKRDHAFRLDLQMIAVLAAQIVGIFLENKLMLIAAVVCGFALCIISYNQMMGYVERRAFLEKKPRNSENNEKTP